MHGYRWVSKRFWRANRVLDRFCTSSCRTSSQNCKSGFVLVWSICCICIHECLHTKKQHRLCICSKQLCMSWVCTSNTVQTKCAFQNNSSCKKIIEHLKHMPSCICRTLLHIFWTNTGKFPLQVVMTSCENKCHFMSRGLLRELDALVKNILTY